MTHYRFIVNSRAGKGKALKAWAAVHQRLGELGLAYYSEPTKLPGAAQDWAPSGVLPMNDSYSYVEATPDAFTFIPPAQPVVLVAVGGDGTMHHAAQAALKNGWALGVIPSGTGNDFATALDIPADPLAALETVFAGRYQALDVAATGERYIVNAGGFGLDASVVNYIERRAWLKRIGSLGYAVALVGVLWGFRPFTADVTIDGENESFHDIYLLAIANGPSFGGGMRLAPTAEMADGQLDICVVAGLTRLKILLLFPSIYNGTHVRNRHVHLRRGREIVLHMQRPDTVAEYDGEPTSANPDTVVTLVPRRLHVFVPVHVADAAMVPTPAITPDAQARFPSSTAAVERGADSL